MPKRCLCTRDGKNTIRRGASPLCTDAKIAKTLIIIVLKIIKY